MSEYRCVVNQQSFIYDIYPEDGTVHLCCPDAYMYLSAEDAVKMANELLSAVIEIGVSDV